jgi:hypothetical protein
MPNPFAEDLPLDFLGRASPSSKLELRIAETESANRARLWGLNPVNLLQGTFCADRFRC